MEAIRTQRRFVMGKRTYRIPPALKHGIYSGIGLLPTENSAKFRKFKKERFAELGLVGRLEEDIGDQIFCYEWRLKNLITYALAARARQRRNSISAQFNPPLRISPMPSLLLDYYSEPEPEPLNPKEVAARSKAADDQARAELGAAINLVELGDVVTYGYLKEQLGIMEQLEAMIARAYKKLLYVRGIKSMSPSVAATPPQPLLSSPA